MVVSGFSEILAIGFLIGFGLGLVLILIGIGINGIISIFRHFTG